MLTQHTRSPEVNPQDPTELSIVAHTYNHSTWGVEAGRSEVQGYPWLCSMFEARLGYMSPVSKTKAKPTKYAEVLKRVSCWEEERKLDSTVFRTNTNPTHLLTSTPVLQAEQSHVVFLAAREAGSILTLGSHCLPKC